MEEYGVVPDVIDAVPIHSLEVIYLDNKIINFGNELTPSDVKEQPSVIWNSEFGTYYTLAMVDPDAPSRDDPKISEVKHWLVGNILGSDISSGQTIAEYLGSGPPKGTGLHRYIFLVYKQNQIINFNEPFSSKTTRAHRLHFSMRKFAEKYDLGQPLFGNFYQAKWDPHVEIRNQNLTSD